MNTFLAWLFLAPFVVLACYGIYRGARWVRGYSAWGAPKGKRT